MLMKKYRTTVDESRSIESSSCSFDAGGTPPSKTKIVGIHAFSAQRISDGKQSGVNESSLDDRKIYGRDGWAERASIV